MVFTIIASLFNVFYFKAVKDSLIGAYYEKVTAEAQTILTEIDSVNRDPTALPNVNSFQVWHSNAEKSSLIKTQGNFPESFHENFPLLNANMFVPGLEEPSILELDDITYCIVEAALIKGQPDKLTIITTQNNNNAYAQISSLRQSQIYMSITAALISFLVALVVSGWVLKPIKALITQARRIKASEKMERVPVSSANDELTELGLTMNKMIEGIESSIQHQSQFFTSAAHELRTPLANMQAQLDLTEPLSNEAPNTETLSSFRQELQRLKRVVEYFLLMSQLKSDTLSLQLTEFRLDDLVYDVLEKMHFNKDDEPFEFHLEIDPHTDHSIKGDNEKMESILVNLFQNAQKYGDISKPIEFHLKRTNSNLKLFIRNKVSLTKAKNHGNQLGLWICEQLSQKQGFEFSYSNDGGYFNAQINIPFSEHNSQH
ncbi:hypothetical protein BFP71_05465 [Roseivirga misakiensis]|uniref:histidine kinase n=1 Tax=Roseivirga misakiensis TaxID=1563681 RepID=A0A1E5T6Y0_9BACT|nr:hypothetical protein BFP71_05465 [Roseivirga misakiensis]